MLDPVLYIQHHRVGMYRDYEEDGTPIIRAYPTHRLTPKLRSFIRDHRDKILELLKTPDLDHTVGNILALEPHELDELRAEIATKDPAELWYDHDTEALRRAEEIIAQRERHAAAIRLEEAS